MKDELAQAEQRFLAAGARWTFPRRHTYEMLATAGRPVKAYDLIATFEGVKRPAKPPTVYRALDFLASLGLVHRVASLNAFVACADPGEPHSGEFLICDCCGRVDELRESPTSPALTAAARRGFTIERFILEAHGRCAECSKLKQS